MSKSSPLSMTGAALLCLACPVLAQELPEGDGKKAVQAACVQCHELERTSAAGYSIEGWRNNLHMMVNAGAPLPKDQIEMVAQYLAKNFPEKPRPEAVVVPGSVKINIRERPAPTPGSRPPATAMAPDGTMWYTGQFANLLGRLDLKTGQIREFPLPAQSGPHGLIADKEGNIWYTGNFGAKIGKLDPKTGKATEYPMPDKNIRDPHTAIFDQKGILWFTAQNANIMGRIDPRTGEVKIIPSLTPKSRPYGMVVSSKGVPFIVLFGANKIASIDPDTLAVREYALPSAATRARRIAITSDDVLWYSDYSRGYLGRFDPASGKATEWPSPGGSRSQPYGIASIRDVIWYSESGTKPNTIVRFDPKTEKFQTWVIPSGGGVVRNVDVTKEGNLAIACSGVNGIGLVEIMQ